jgi:hypothetical protein
MCCLKRKRWQPMDSSPCTQARLVSPWIGAPRRDVFSVLCSSGKHTKYRQREFITWNDQASLQCCSTGPCGAGVWDDARPTWMPNGTQANRVHGTNGDQFRFFVKKGDTLPAFVNTLFRCVGGCGPVFFRWNPFCSSVQGAGHHKFRRDR